METLFFTSFSRQFLLNYLRFQLERPQLSNDRSLTARWAHERFWQRLWFSFFWHLTQKKLKIMNFPSVWLLWFCSAPTSTNHKWKQSEQKNKKLNWFIQILWHPPNFWQRCATANPSRYCQNYPHPWRNNSNIVVLSFA